MAHRLMCARELIRAVSQKANEQTEGELFMKRSQVMQEMLRKAQTAKSAEELLTLAKDNGAGACRSAEALRGAAKVAKR